jgi:hypothetical protein
MDLGARFWLIVLGVAVGGAVAFVLLLALLGWAWYTWGLLGAVIFFLSVLGLLAWISDRRVRKRYGSVSE